MRNLERISIKDVFTSNLTFINPYNTLFGLQSQKKSVISLYWFAAKRQTSTLSRYSSRSIYSKTNVELSELTPTFQNLQKIV